VAATVSSSAAGAWATEKVEGLLDCGAVVTVVAPEIDGELRALPVALVERRFARSDVVGRFLVIAATNARSVNAAVSRARKSGRRPATSPTIPSSAASSCRRLSAATRSSSVSRPAARRRRSRSASAPTSPT